MAYLPQVRYQTIFSTYLILMLNFLELQLLRASLEQFLYIIDVKPIGKTNCQTN